MSTKRTFLVTGATKGIGHATVTRLAQAGHDIIGIARHAPKQFPGQFVVLDLADEQATKKTFSDLSQNHTIDGIVNNVGMAITNYLPDITIEECHQLMEINFRHVIQGTQIFAPKMQQNGWGRIVNIASMTILGSESFGAYAAAKAAIVAFTRCCALELVSLGITANVVAPGAVDTGLFHSLFPKGSDREQQVLQEIPMHRLGKTEETAAAIAFLLSEEAGYITGQTLFIDGGRSIGKMS